MSASALLPEYVPSTPRLAYIQAGAGDAVVFLHGIGGNRSNWLRQLDALSSRYRAIAWDARGYGDSDDYDGDLDFAAFRADLLRLLDHLELDQAHICGLSMGGRIALDFYDHFPQRVASLILADTFPGFDDAFTTEARERFINERRQPLLDGKTVADIAKVLAPALVAKSASPEIIEELELSISSLHKQSYIKTVEAMTRYVPVTDLASVTVPTQIIVGAEDKLTPPSMSVAMQEQCKPARLEVIADAGHLSNIEQAQAFNSCLLDFLTAHQATP